MYKIKSFLGRLGVPFHCEGLVHANFWDPNEYLQQDVLRLPVAGEPYLSLRLSGACLAVFASKPAWPRLFSLAVVPRNTLFIKLARPLLVSISSSYR